MQPIYGFILPIIITLSLTMCTKNYSEMELNRSRLKRFYRNHLLTRPSTKNTSRTVVAVGLGIIEVAGLDPQKQVINLNVNFELKWCDDLLQWNISEQVCVRKNRTGIPFSPNEIWTPDILATNGPGQLSKHLKLQYPVLVYCTGSVRWSYQEKLEAFCKVDVSNFPFDHQHCSIHIQSTIYDSSQLTLRSLYNVVRLYHFINTEWKITHATIQEIDLYNAHHKSDFSTLLINIELVRVSRSYTLKLIIPYIIISSLAVFSFGLPTDSGEKIALTVSVLLSLAIYLQLISDYVPKTEEGMCTLTLFSNVIFLLVFLSCVFNTFITFIYYHQQDSYRPKITKRKKSLVLSVHKSLIELNKQRWTFLKKRRNIHENLPETTDIDAIELLHDIKYFRQSLMNMMLRRNSMITAAAFDFHHPIFNPKKESKRSVKQIATIIDRILFIIYLILMPLSILILLHSIHQSQLASLARTNTTNQLLDLRKASFDPIPRFRNCPI